MWLRRSRGRLKTGWLKKMSLDLSFCFLPFFPPPKTMLSVLESLFLFSLAREVFLFFVGWRVPIALVPGLSHIRDCEASRLVDVT